MLAVVPSSPSVNRKSFDFAIVGSGFSGSLLAWILASQGRSVVLIDKATHPRFAIGESSTPTADFLLAHLAQRWNLSNLAPLACWGTWKNQFPNVLCGKKRGFSYYAHQPNQPINPAEITKNSLLVAASSQDHWSDTHWLRSSVDTFLVEQATQAGVQLLQQSSITKATFDQVPHTWNIDLSYLPPDSRTPDSIPHASIQATWIIDATGPHGSMAAWTRNTDNSHWMRTRTGAVFGHFSDVAHFNAAYHSNDPFCCDDAAQHHILEQGWVWMLRFDHGVTSVGWVHPSSNAPRTSEDFWNTIDAHPSVSSLMQSATLIEPIEMGTIQRISRCRSSAFGPGWIALPVAYGFVDPLHSTGIAHALSGVSRLAELLQYNKTDLYQKLEVYQADLESELKWLDTLVAGCYAAQPSFDNFYAFACFYFVAAIEFEKQLAKDPSHWPQGFLQASDIELREVAESAYQTLTQMSRHDASQSHYREVVRSKIARWNNVGLLDPNNLNRIAHSTAPKYASIIQSMCQSLNKNPTE